VSQVLVELIENLNEFLVKCDAMDYTMHHALEKRAQSTRELIGELEEAISEDEVSREEVDKILASARSLIASARKAADESEDEDIHDAAPELEILLDRVDEQF